MILIYHINNPGSRFLQQNQSMLKIAHSRSRLSLGETGICVFETVPAILFCDLFLAPAQSATCKLEILSLLQLTLLLHGAVVYEAVVGAGAAPTYRGQGVTYVSKVLTRILSSSKNPFAHTIACITMKVTIGLQQAGRVAQNIRLPLRVLPVTGTPMLASPYPKSDE